jgi:threonine/homoserine/homoserine lactone efflux protein
MPVQAFQWGSFIIFALINSSTPGPNNVMLAGSGSAWGYKRTIPHLLGVALGFPLMLLIVQFGAGIVFAKLPWLYPLLTVLCLAYILWLSYRILKLGWQGDLQIAPTSRPMTFWEAVLFQWVNGKAWQAAITVATIYTADSALLRTLTALAFVGILIFACSMWVETGKMIARYLQNERVRKFYYVFLALALVLSAFPTGIKQLVDFGLKI